MIDDDSIGGYIVSQIAVQFTLTFHKDLQKKFRNPFEFNKVPP